MRTMREMVPLGGAHICAKIVLGVVILAGLFAGSWSLPLRAMAADSRVSAIAVGAGTYHSPVWV